MTRAHDSLASPLLGTRLIVAALGTFVWANVSGAQLERAKPYPDRPVRLVAASAPGGGIDIISRLTAQPLSAAWGQQVVVDNRAGGGGTIAINIVAKSDPDGYTLLAIGPGVTYAAALHRKLPFDVKRDLAPVAFMASQPFVLVVNPSVPVQSVTELIRYAKGKPEHVRFGSGGVGGASHLVTELFRATADVNIVHVPYKGTGPGITALLSGEIHMLIVGVPTAHPHVATAKVKALAMTGSKRVSSMPEVPTIAEAGLPGAEVDIWVSLFAPAKTPPALLAKINRDVNTVLQSAQAKRSFDAAGAVPQVIGLDEFNRYITAEAAKWSKVIHSTGLRPE